MKRSIFIALLLLSGLLTACGETENPGAETILPGTDGNTLPPQSLDIMLLNQESGANLLNPEVEENILSNRIKVLADGREYYIENLPEGMEEIVMPYEEERDFNVNLKPQFLAGGALNLFFAAGYRNFEFILDWGDGHTNQFKVNHYQPEQESDKDFHVLWVDGERWYGPWNVVFYR